MHMLRGRAALHQNHLANILKTTIIYVLPSTLISNSLSSSGTKHPTTFCLNSTLRSLLSSGQPQKALVHFLESQRQGIGPDNFTIPTLVKLSIELSQPPLHGQHIHAFSIKSGHINDLFVSTGLVEMYFKHGLLCGPLQLFDEVSQRDVVLFTTMVSGFSQNGRSQEALGFLSKMLEEHIKPNRITVTSVLSVCSRLGELNLGKILHGLSLRSALLDKTDVIFETALVDMYAKCGKLCYAKLLFDRMGERNLVSWHSIISGYSSNGSFETALELLKDMISEGWHEPKSSTLALVLNICGVTTDLRKGKEMHSYILKSINSNSESDRLIKFNAILDMYVKTGNIDSAVTIFRSMSKRNVVTWTMMISGYGAYGLTQKALDAYKEMKESGIRPDGITFIALLSACSHGRLVDDGRELYMSMQRDYGIVPEMKHIICMVDLYGRAGLLEKAHDFIKTVPVEPSGLMWGALLSSCRIHKKLDLGIYAAKKALEMDPYNVGNYVLLSRLYADASRWDDVAKVRLVMKELGLRPDTAYSWVELRGNVYKFTCGDTLKAYSNKIYEFLDKLGTVMKKAGFAPDTSSISHNVGEEEKVRDLCGHTERLALGFMLMGSRGEGTIRIGKNLRVCIDCHKTFKYISMICNREIILKDPNRYHRFSQGSCSCQDFW